MSMNKSGFSLTIGILYFSITLPLAEKKHFTPGVRCNLQHLVYMLFFHHQNQVRLIDNVRGDLPRCKGLRAVPMFFQDLARRRFHGLANASAETCGGDCNG